MLNTQYNSGIINKAYADEVIKLINNPNYYHYFYYNSSSSYNDSSPLDKSNYYVIFMKKNSFTATIYNSNWYGINGINQYTLTPNSGQKFLQFRYITSSSEWLDSEITSSIYAPYEYINYTSPTMSSWLTAYSSGNVGQMQLILQSTQAIQSATEQTQQDMEDTKDFLTDSSMSDSSMSTNTPSVSGGDVSVNGFFTGFFNLIKTSVENVDSDSVDTIEIPIPNGNNNLVLRSDCVSGFIEDSLLYTIIQACYWYGFGCYILWFVYRIINWVQSGEAVEGGLSRFITRLDKENAIIKSYMM